MTPRPHRAKSRYALLALLAVFLVAGLALRPALVRLDYSQLFSRASWQLPDRVVERLELSPGARVADLGAGDGYFTFRLADAVGPAGKVFVVEVDESAVRKLRETVERLRYANVEVVLAAPGDPHLPDGVTDLVFLCNVYHHLDDRVAYFDRLRSDLKPNGHVAIVEVRDSLPLRLFTPRGHWTGLETLRDEMAAAHYRREKSFDFLPLQYFEIFSARPEGLKSALHRLPTQSGT